MPRQSGVALGCGSGLSSFLPSAGDRVDVTSQAWIILAVGALISFLGVPAGLLGNELSIRYGLRTVATLVFLLSALTGGLFGFTAMLPYIVVLGLSVVV